MAIDNDTLMEFLGRFVGDLGATAAAGNVVIGDRLGLYQALAKAPATAGELAARTNTTERYVTEWLRGQAAGGYIQYDAEADSYSMSEEQAFALTDPDGAVYLPGAFQLALGSLQAVPRITEASSDRSSARNSSHSVTITSASASFAAAWASEANSTWGISGRA